MDISKMVLAMYDFRSKQNFIYRTNKMKEIVGASAIIRDGFQWLYDAADKFGQNIQGKGLFRYNLKEYKELLPSDADISGFSKEKLCVHIEEGYCGEVLYEGGGNLFVIYKDADTCVNINKIFTADLIKETYGLKCICSYTNALLEEDDFKKARENLYRKHAHLDMMEASMYPVSTLPFVQVDGTTSFPLTHIDQNGNKISDESAKKLEKYISQKSEMKDQTLLQDDIVTKKGTESLLALIYIDGNNMGKKLEQYLTECSYDICVNQLRKFSANIDHVFVDEGMVAVNHVLEKESEKLGQEVKKRIVVAAGDEVTFICNARVALKAAKAYLDAVFQNQGFSSCAGIVIFHSHAPFASVYRIAEACCESAKKRMKQYQTRNEKIGEACFLDFHFCQGAIDGDLKRIRQRENSSELSRPWLVNIREEDEDLVDIGQVRISDVDEMLEKLRNCSRGNIKTLTQKAIDGSGSFEMETRRLASYKNLPEDTFVLSRLHDLKEKKEISQRLIYDIGVMYDIWFAND